LVEGQYRYLLLKGSRLTTLLHGFARQTSLVNRLSDGSERHLFWIMAAVCIYGLLDAGTDSQGWPVPVTAAVGV